MDQKQKKVSHSSNKFIQNYMDEMPPLPNIKLETFKIASIYFWFAIFWLLTSRNFVGQFHQLAEDEYRSFFYLSIILVIITATVLYFLIKKQFTIIKKANEHIAENYEDLSVTYEQMVAAEMELIKQKDLTDLIIEKTPAIISVIDLKTSNVIKLNEFALAKFGYGEDELINQHTEKYTLSTRAINANTMESQQLTKDGKELTVLWNYNIIDDPGSDLDEKIIAVGMDITEQKQIEDKLNSLAYFDDLTGLPNKPKLELDVDDLIKDESMIGFSLIFLDVDNFKDINDALGHNAGDIFLQYVAISLQKVVRPPHQVYRMSGDEFAIIIKNVLDKIMIDDLIKDINHSIGNVWNTNAFDFYVTSSMGVSQYPTNGIHGSELIRSADIAMYKAKREGKNRHIFYTDEIHVANMERIYMVNQLQRAIDNGEFALLYQPQIELKTESLVGVEVLIRWVHPERGIISPLEFISLAEETGQIYDIEEWVFREALRQQKAWQEAGHPLICMSINLSSKTLNSEPNFVRLEKMLAEQEFEPGEISIEITETAIIDDTSQARARLQRFKDMGINIALDDFGTGYSSITHLIDMPIDTVKIDRSFIMNIGEGEKETTIVNMILKIAEEFNYHVVAEGVETIAQKDYLRDHDCGLGQGFLFDKPLKAIEIENRYLAKMDSVQQSIKLK